MEGTWPRSAAPTHRDGKQSVPRVTSLRSTPGASHLLPRKLGRRLKPMQPPKKNHPVRVVFLWWAMRDLNLRPRHYQ